MTIQIGQLSKQTGVNIETIRYYEKQGLMMAPPRSEGGRRQYEAAHIARLSFIRRCRQLGFSLKEIRGLIDLVNGGYSCAQIRDITIRHQNDIQKKITDLKRLDKTLGEMADRCTGTKDPNCPVIDALFAEQSHFN